MCAIDIYICVYLYQLVTSKQTFNLCIYISICIDTLRDTKFKIAYAVLAESISGPIHGAFLTVESDIPATGGKGCVQWNLLGKTRGTLKVTEFFLCMLRRVAYFLLGDRPRKRPSVHGCIADRL